jgi:penicillin G amidase
VRIALRIFLGAIALVTVLALAEVVNVWFGMRATAQVSGTISATGLTAPVHILRDGRGVPHIRALNEHDLFFAQGYVEGQDRLFQLDLLRRFVYGRLAEVLGSAVLDVDENARIVPVRRIVGEQWSKLDARERAILTAFADGVNAAAQHESTPVEFRALAYRFERWQPQDALAVGFATVLDLTDDWNDIAARGGPMLLSDRCFDAPVMAGLRGIADPSHCSRKTSIAMLLKTLSDPRPPIGSNEWAAGSAHTTTHRALLANDPHLRLQIPGVWYLVDLQAPGFHAAGATLAGAPGIILGHNERIAWGSTNGTVAAMSLFFANGPAPDVTAHVETFHVRFGDDFHQRYFEGKREFETVVDVGGHQRIVFVRWPAYSDPQSPLSTFEQLDRANSIEDALRALARYPGPTQNFELADLSGRVAYQLAGDVPNDPVWAQWIHPFGDRTHTYPAVPFARLPAVPPARDAIVWTSNNKMYGRDYPLRLSPQFAPPCRAFRVATLLRARATYDVDYFRHMQMDVFSPCEQQLARLTPPFASWNGEVVGDSDLATQVVRLRMALVHTSGSMINALASSPPTAIDPNTSPAQPWSVAGAVQVRHPLAQLGFSFLNGTRFAGNGDSYTVHVQNDGFSQSFHAVWDVGNWDAGGITIPQGESGRPGSGHYTDEAADWVAGRLLPLPFSREAVDRAAVDRLTLVP